MRIGKLKERSIRLAAGSTLIALAVVVAGWWAASAAARSAEETKVTVHDTVADPASSRTANDVSALQVEIDPETGALRAASTGGVGLASKVASDGFDVSLHHDGSVGVNLAGNHLSLSVAHVGADGTVHTNCVDDAHAIDQLATQEVHDDRR